MYVYMYIHTMFYFLSKMKNVHHFWTFNMRLEFFKTIPLVLNPFGYNSVVEMYEVQGSIPGAERNLNHFSGRIFSQVPNSPQHLIRY